MNRGFWRKARSVRGLLLVKLAALRAALAEIMARLRAVASAMGADASTGRIVHALETCAESIKGVSEGATAGLVRLEARRAAAGDYFRLMQVSYRTLRRPTRPDILKTLLIIMGFWLLEGMMAGGVLISGGKMDVAAGLSYGMIFALVNIILGVLTGFLGLRYLGYRQAHDIFGEDDGHPDRGDLIRRLALGGTIAGLAAEGVLIFSAARLRSLGTHEGAFSFSEIGLFATYDDSLAIVITVIGVCSAIMAIREGYRGLADPVPGYDEAYAQATSEIEAAAEGLAGDAIEAIETACVDALEDAEAELEGALGGFEETEAAFLEIAGAIDAHNNAVTAAREDARAAARKSHGIGSFIRGRVSAGDPPFDGGVFEALILPRIDDLIAEHRARGRTDAAPVREAMHRVEAACRQAPADIRAAEAAFAASAPNLDSLFDEGEDDDTQ